MFFSNTKENIIIFIKDQKGILYQINDTYPV